MFTMSTDRLQTVLGMLEAAIIAGADFVYAYLTAAEGQMINWKDPLFITGMVLAVLRGWKSVYAAGVKSVPAEGDKETPSGQ